ncbi:hypothetical protein D3C81_1977620 [compost metagenome]
MFLGPIKPHQTVASSFGQPSDWVVGSPGTDAVGLLPYTASALSEPDWIWEITSSGLMDMNDRRPPSKSVMAGLPPL